MVIIIIISRGKTEVIFGILSLSLLFGLFIECTAILMEEMTMVLICRLIIFTMLTAVYNFQSQLNCDSLARGKKRIVRIYNCIILGICLLTILFHLSYLRFHFSLYSSFIILISLFVSVEEYLQIEWLWKIQITRKTTILDDTGESEIKYRATLYQYPRNLLHAITTKYYASHNHWENDNYII